MSVALLHSSVCLYYESQRGIYLDLFLDEILDCFYTFFFQTAIHYSFAF